MKKINLQAEKRTLCGRKVKKLRLKGLLPANIYGKKIKSQALELKAKEFIDVFKEAGETSIVDLTLGKDKTSLPVLIHQVQKDPVSENIIHVDFYKVDLTQKVQVEIPIELTGESAAVVKGGVLVPLMSAIQIEALPADLPDKFLVDISSISEIGQSICVKDLKFDKSKIKTLVEDETQLIVKVEEPKKEEEVKPVEAAPAEGEAVAEGEAAPAETKPGEAKPGEDKPGAAQTPSKPASKEEKKK